MNEVARPRTHPFRGVIGVGGSLLALVLSVPLGLVAGVAAFLAAAHVTDGIATLSVAALAAGSLVTWGLSSLGVRGITNRPAVRRALPHGFAAIGLLALTLGGSLLVFPPMDVEYVAMEPTADTPYWDLPTGSRIAYWHRPARSHGHLSVVVFLHGGPGAPGDLSPGEAGEVLAEAGFNVYHYHQVGSGLSSRLDDVSLYTVDRHVDDLDAIRREIGAERLVLIGGSWGGTLASHYMARYPDRVDRVVFASPGAIWSPGLASGSGPVPESDGDEVDVVAEAATPRFGVVYYLLQVNPRAAHNLASDDEMSGFFQPLLAQIIAGDVAACGEGVQGAGDEQEHRRAEGDQSRPHRAEQEPVPDGWVPAGFGFYAMMVTNASVERSLDPRERLREVDVPVLVLRGECDRIRREVHEEYFEVFPDANLLEVEGVAHSVSASPRYPEILLDFLTENLHADTSVGQVDTLTKPGSWR